LSSPWCFTHGRYREGFVVRFYPETGEPWVGNFQRGVTHVCHVLGAPSSTLMTVIAGGQAYELDIATRQLPWDGMRRVSVNRLVLSGEA